MKISEELSTLYGDIKTDGWEPGSLRILADALQQAVAENLDLKHRLVAHCNFRFCGDCKNKDWLAEADKLLRGEK